MTCEDSSSTATAAAAGTANVRAGLSDHTTDSRVKIPSLFALTSPPDLTCDHRLATCMPLAIWTYELNSGVNLQQITRERLSIMRFSLSAVGVHSIIAPRFPPTKGTPLPLPSLPSASDPLFPHTHTQTLVHMPLTSRREGEGERLPFYWQIHLALHSWCLNSSDDEDSPKVEAIDRRSRDATPNCV